ncbi:ZIP zinc/iron transport family [Aspergillus violaceofuscus CBS 115571]|uniref:ZIP zinc/iron transport family n=1 Tax=Aspergillus violaceofuscus (strain CBS 115571) TaxID=1450538 RepID=A0A2V5GVS9_ASPV1|nr:ZIP zinc/iron transport family [Aspergillus violaceofuscus CBS 115571]
MDSLHTLVARDDGCPTGNEYDGRIGLRISSIFVIFIGSSFGALFPVFARSFSDGKLSKWAFFVAKYFGSGVIIATAFIHLLAPAEEALTSDCLTGPITEYSWTEAIVLMTIVVLFFVELMVMRYARFGHGHAHDSDSEEEDDDSHHHHHHHIQHHHHHVQAEQPVAVSEDFKGHMPGEDHLGHSREHHDVEAGKNHSHLEEYMAQLTSIFILEFGIIFHSVFIGLTLAVTGTGFVTLYVVLVFHQTFEGLGLGSRLATVPWPRAKRWTPYFLGLGFGVSTPIAIAIGLGVRNSYADSGATTLIVSGVFDAISAGILIYTALVELLAHEFMFSTSMRKAPIHVVLSAFGLLCLGALLMALLGKWA